MMIANRLTHATWLEVEKGAALVFDKLNFYRIIYFLG